MLNDVLNGECCTDRRQNQNVIDLNRFDSSSNCLKFAPMTLESNTNTIYEETCPAIYDELKKTAQEAMENPAKIWLYMFLCIFIAEIQKEKGLEGLRELEKQYTDWQNSKERAKNGMPPV